MSAARVWIALAAGLLLWNGVAARYGNPLNLVQGYDSPQYQLLARNRLHGHTEVGDTAHTVRQEGAHPMWRPGLVWVLEGFARCLGSVTAAAPLASALGTTLMELALLWLAWRCFGRGACVLALLALLALSPVCGFFLWLAVGQGPEPWSAAAILAGLALLVEARRHRSWPLAILAGTAAGLAEWFRTGNLLLFAGPCAVYALISLGQREWRRFALPMTAGLAFMGIAALGGLTVPSPVNKTAVNLRHNLAEQHDRLIEESEAGPLTVYLGGLRLAPGTEETYYDFIVRDSRGVDSRQLLREQAAEIGAVYRHNLGQVFRGGARGLRAVIGPLVLSGFIVQVVVGLLRRRAGDANALAFAAGALAHYLGPVVLLRSDLPTHYLYVALPLFVLVAARGAVSVAELVSEACQRRWPVVTLRMQSAGRILLVVSLAPAVCLGVIFYAGALKALAGSRDKARQARIALDALPLQGQKIACRSMSWFVDRDVRTVLLPYADVPQLERYAQTHNLDGILLWDDEPALLFRITPYESIADLDRAIRDSSVFGPAQCCGGWRYYPVRRPLYSEVQP